MHVWGQGIVSRYLMKAIRKGSTHRVQLLNFSVKKHIASEDPLSAFRFKFIYPNRDDIELENYNTVATNIREIIMSSITHFIVPADDMERAKMNYYKVVETIIIPDRDGENGK